MNDEEHPATFKVLMTSPIAHLWFGYGIMTGVCLIITALIVGDSVDSRRRPNPPALPNPPAERIANPPAVANPPTPRVPGRPAKANPPTEFNDAD